ncbi:MAG: tetratricopeptide repeat protein [Nitrospirae bacterium]|nr:tetratricopeptide repeat protein [Nitrospirota bacterium]
MKADKKIIAAIIIVAFLLMLLNIVSSAYAGEEAVKKAMEKYDIHHYEDGIALLKKEIDARSGDDLVLPYFILGRLYLKQAGLYRAIYETSLMTTNEYLTKLNGSKSGRKSRYLSYFLGLLHLEMNQPKKAAAYLQQFINSSPPDERFREKARLRLGMAYYLMGEKKKGEDYWRGVSAKDEEIIAEKGYILVRLNTGIKDALEMAQNAIKISQKSGRKDIQLYRNAAYVYYKNDMADAALELLDKMPSDEAVFVDNMERNKVIKFYDPSAIGDISAIYYYAAGKYFNRVMNLRGRERYEDLVRYYLGEVSYGLGRYDAAIDEINNFVKLSKRDARYNERARVLLGACYYKKGDKKKAEEIWNDVLNKNPQDAGIISELMDTYAELKVEDPAILKRMEEKGSSSSRDEKLAKPFYMSLGRLYYNKRDYERSVQTLELARDKGNKNKLETNDPVFLIRLADGYYRLRKYSESLEIFFGIGKVYPIVRQIQDTIQGVYSAEEKGSGEARIN